MRLTTSAGRDFRTYDPWDLALAECEPVASDHRGEMQARYRVNLPVDREDAIRGDFIPAGWDEVPIRTREILLPVPASQRSDVSVALSRRGSINFIGPTGKLERSRKINVPSSKENA